MRPRILLFGLAAVIIIAFIVLSLADSVVVDLLWFGTLGYRNVFTITLGGEIAIFVIVWAIAFLAIWISGMIALRESRERERLHVVGRSDGMSEINLPELIRTLGDRVPWKLLVLGGAAILALFAAQGEASSWDVYLKALYGVPFGVKEPAFGLELPAAACLNLAHEAFGGIEYGSMAAGSPLSRSQSIMSTQRVPIPLRP